MFNTQRTPRHAWNTFFYLIHHIKAADGKVHSNQLCHPLQLLSLVGKETKGKSISDGWAYRQLLMEFWKTLTVVVGLDVRQNVVPVKKQNWSVLVLVPVGIAQVLPTRIQTRTICQNDDDDDDGLLFELDGDDTGFDGLFEEQWW